MIDRLEILKKRYDELNEQLMDPNNLSDIKKTREISKEMSNLEETVTCYEEYKKILKNIEEDKELLKDAELGQFAEDEIKGLEEEKEKTFKKILPLFASADNGKGKYELDEKQTAYVEIKSKRKRPDIDETRLQTDYPDIYADCMKFDKGLLKKKYIQIYNAYELPSSPSGEFKYKISLHKKKE